MTPVISLENIIQTYSGRTVLEVGKLDIAPKGIYGLSGPNGSGKSTLLRILAFIDAPTSGIVRFMGAPTATRPGAVHRQVTLLVQEPYLLKRTVFANIAFGLKLREEKDIAAKVHDALLEVGLNPETFAKRQWYELSGGEAQRVALAARLVLKPKVLLMDEPTASLDKRSAQLIRQAALAARDRNGTSLVIASHDLDWLSEVSDHIVCLDHGTITEIT